MGVTGGKPSNMGENELSDEDLPIKGYNEKSRPVGNQRNKPQEAKIPAKLEQILINQNKMIETLTTELKSLKNHQQEEGREELQKQIERLERMLEKKEQKAEQEQFHYELKKVQSSDIGHGRVCQRTWGNLSRSARRNSWSSRRS